MRTIYDDGRDGAVMITTPETRVLALQMVREVEVPCHALSHGEAPVKVLHDLAKGPKPRSVFCGDCAASADDAAGF
jgi:hypothetical protein